MISLNNLLNPTIDDYALIVNSKHDPRKTRLYAISPLIVSRYSLYENCFNSNCLETIIQHNFTQTESEDLLHCYLTKTVALDKLKARIKSNQPERIKSVCQYCGIDTDSTFDHFLSKETYPDYSVNHLNLIPCCPNCNLFKGTDLFDLITRNRLFINLYLDNLPNFQYLFVNIGFLGQVPSCSFYLDNPNNDIDNDTFRLIRSHYSKLHLLERYNDKFSTIYARLKIDIDLLNTNDPQIISSTLLDKSLRLSGVIGPNHMEVVIQKELAINPDFLSLF